MCVDVLPAHVHVARFFFSAVYLLFASAFNNDDEVPS